MIGKEGMKRFFIAAVLALVVLALFLASGLGSLLLLGKRLDRESRAFVDKAVPAIVSEWDLGEVQKRASDEFNNSVNYDDLEEVFAAFQDLGRFEAYKGSNGDSNITLSVRYGFELTADYAAAAEFENGIVTLQLSLIKQGDQWRILDLQIVPELFSEKKDII